MEGTTLSPWFILVLGMSTVFIGLICLIFISKLMSFFCKFKRKSAEQAPSVAVVPENTQPVITEEIPDRGQFVAAVSAAIASEMGADVAALRILEIKKLG